MTYKMRFSLLLTILLTLALGVHLVVGQSIALEVELYEPLTLQMEIEPDTYTDPFNSADIELIGIFQAPDGNQQVVTGFWMQPYDADLQPDGDAGWYVRFTPQQVGNWTYTLQVRDNGALAEIQDGTFSVAPSDRHGFIRIGANERYFRYPNGETYFPVGHNLKWSWDGAGGLDTYLDWLRDLNTSGGNYARLFIDVPWFIQLDWSGPPGDYRQSQQAAAQLDIILDTAEEYDIALQLVLLWHQSLEIYNGPPVLIPEVPARPNTTLDWDNHPYNIVNGGPLSGPGVFLYNEQAESLLQKRLHYIVARWGYSPQIFAWELIDQIDRVNNYDPGIAGDWLQQNIGYLRRIDTHGHLITAGSENYDPVIAENPYVDFTTTQFYQLRPIETVGDQVTSVVNLLRQQLAVNPIPVLLTDYSLNPWYEPTADDPQGIHFQNTLWASALSGAAGGAMSDWWDTYIIPQDLSRYYAPLSAFAAGIDWVNLNLQPAEAGLLLQGEGEYLSVRLSDYDRQFTRPIRDVVRRDITPDGVFPALNQMPSYLYGKVFNNQFSQAQLFRVTPSVDTYLELAVRSVSTQASAHLVVTVDGQNAVELDLRAGTRDVAVRVPLSAGEHTLSLDNTGQDWLELDYLEIGQLIAPARVETLRDTTAGVALAWIQHRDYTWEQVAAGVNREAINLRYQLNRMPAGRYSVEIWDPISGGVIGEEAVEVAEDGILAIDLVPMDSMLALRAFLQPDDTPAEVTIPATFAPTDIPAISETAEPTATRARTAVPLIAQTNTPRASEAGS